MSKDTKHAYKCTHVSGNYDNIPADFSALNAPKRKHRRSKGDGRQSVSVRKAFATRPSTRFMAALAAGVERAYICKYVDDWRKQGTCWLLYTAPCEVSGHLAEYLTTNRDTYERWLEFQAQAQKGGAENA